MARGAKIFSTAEVPESNETGYPGPYRALNMKRYYRRIGDFAGLKNYGVNVVRVVPGGQSSCRHAHSRQDELVYVMSGELILETDAGRETVGAGTWVGFPAGTGDAHRFVNESAADATLIVIGDRTPGDEVVYPDVDLALVRNKDGSYRYTRKDGTSY
ncbi:MAG: cupin domain-containing protein [Hyphomicrobiales bacterium]|nr:cupin domain-containing protein [Hyphomicrobiales bacterium]